LSGSSSLHLLPTSLFNSTRSFDRLYFANVCHPSLSDRSRHSNTICNVGVWHRHVWWPGSYPSLFLVGRFCCLQFVTEDGDTNESHLPFVATTESASWLYVASASAFKQMILILYISRGDLNGIVGLSYALDFPWRAKATFVSSAAPAPWTPIAFP
jgi:hypothetical protein